MPSARVLKSLVIALALAIAVSLVFVIYGVVRPWTANPGDAEVAAPTFVSLNQPDGSEIESVSASGSDLLIRIRGGGVPDRVVVFDRRSATVRQTIQISGPAAP
jgi:hypothetical protein